MTGANPELPSGSFPDDENVQLRLKTAVLEAEIDCI